MDPDTAPEAPWPTTPKAQPMNAGCNVGNLIQDSSHATRNLPRTERDTATNRLRHIMPT